MATLEDQLVSSFSNTVNTQGPNIKLDAQVLQAKKKKTLTFQQLKDLLETGSEIPDGFELPTNLTKAQMGQLPGGLSAFQNIPGFGMMESIKETAGFGAGPGGVDTDPNEEEEIPVNNILAHNCPNGYMFDSIKQSCVPIADDDDGPDYDNTQNSYNSFVEMVTTSPNFDGTMESFNENANNSWMGQHWTSFFNDDGMLSNTLNNIVGPDIISGGGGYVDFEGMPTSFTDQQISDYQTANQQPEPVIIPNELLPDVGGNNDKPDNAGTIIQSSSPATTPMSAVGNVNMGGSGIQDPSQIPQQNNNDNDNNNNSGGSTPFENVNSGGGEDLSAGFSGEFGFNTGGFVEQAKPIQLDDVSLKMQEGGEVPIEGMPMDQPIPTEGMEGMPVPSGQPAGFIEDPSAAPAPENTVDAMQGEGQQDDVMGELPEGTFVINAMAVQLAGLDELDKMVENAYETMVEMLKEKGVEVPLIQQLVDRSKSIGKVDVAVSNGEYIIPPELVPIIGEDKLRKINDRGLRKLEETKKTREKEQAPVQMDDGGFVIATDPDGKIQTVKEKTDDGREVSRILSRDEADSLGVTKQGKQGTSFIPKPKAPEDKKEPEVKSTNKVTVEPSDKVNVEKLDLLGPKPKPYSRFFGPEQTIENQLSIPDDVKGFMQQEQQGPKQLIDELSLKQQQKLIRSEYNNKNLEALNNFKQSQKISAELKDRINEYILSLTVNKSEGPKTTSEIIDNAMDNQVKFNLDKRKYDSSVYKKVKYDGFVSPSLKEEAETSVNQESVGEQISKFIKSIMPKIDPKAKERFKNYMQNNVGQSVQTGFGITNKTDTSMSDEDLIQKFAYENYKNLSEEEINEAKIELQNRFGTDTGLGFRNFNEPTNGNIDWIDDALMDAIRQKESSNRHLEADGTLFKHNNSKALGAYGIKPTTAADPGAKFVELNPDLVPIADLTKVLDEDKHREFAKNYLIAITLRYPNFSPMDVIRSYNAGFGKVNQVLTGTGTFNDEAQNYPNQVLDILQSGKRTGGFV